jgi:hypothetical protein
MIKKILKISTMLLLFLHSNLSIGQTNRYLEIEHENGYNAKYKNGEKISFKDTFSNLKSGKLYIINDSEFVFLNYFNESTNDTFKTKSIGSMKIDMSNMALGGEKRNKRFIPLGAIIVCAFFVPAASIVFLILNSTHPRNKNIDSNKYSTWIDAKDLTISIKKVAPISTE